MAKDSNRRNRIVLKDWVKVTLAILAMIAAMGIAGKGDYELAKTYHTNHW